MRLATVAGLPVLSAGVITYFDPVEARKSGLQFAMHGLHLRSRLGSATNVRLVRDHDEKKSGGFKTHRGVHDIGIELEFTQARRRIGSSRAHDGGIQNAVAVQENGTLDYLMLSHFVSLTFKSGCDTRRCQTTA